MDFSFPTSIKDLSDLIRQTPHAPREDVEFYHARVIELLDGLGIMKVPSMPHRSLHQEIWIAAFMVYNGFKDFDEAFTYFFNGEGKGETFLFQSQRNRFNLWYDNTYIKPYLDKNDQYEWAKKQRENDEGLSNQLRVPIEAVAL